MKRIKFLKKSGTGADDIVEPTLWYFEEMNFLIGREEPCTSLNTVQIGEEGEQESDKRWLGGIAYRIVRVVFLFFNSWRNHF